MQFVLASGSPRRRELLASLGVEFVGIKSDIDETQRAGEAPYDYVRRLSVEKAEAVAARLDQPSIVLAADTVVILAADTIGVTESGEILGKPTDADDARSMLCRLRGRDHVVCTALALRDLVSGKSQTELTRTTVTMRDYSDAEIDSYIATGDPFDKAGGYAIQHEGFHPVERIDGSYSNVVGLPLEMLRRMLVDLRVPNLRFQMPIDEFLSLPETNLPTELIEGWVFARRGNTEIHQRILGKTLFLLADVDVRKQGQLLPGPIDLYLDDLNVIQPDILWISPERSDIADDRWLRAAPDLVIEVLSPETVKRDRGIKLDLYEKYGAREYWMIDPISQMIEVWRRDGDKFSLHGVFGVGETFISAVLGEKMIEVASIFNVKP